MFHPVIVSVLVQVHHHLVRLVSSLKVVEVDTMETDIVFTLEEKGVDIIELSHLVETVVHGLEG